MDDTAAAAWTTTERECSCSAEEGADGVRAGLSPPPVRHGVTLSAGEDVPVADADRAASDEELRARIVEGATGGLPAVAQISRAAQPQEVREAEITPPQIVEALLFACDTPLSATRLAELVGTCTRLEIRLHVADLNAKYAQAGLSFRIESIARGYRMMTLPIYRPWLSKLEKQHSQTRLSAAALETLSIIAYKQPIIRADIEAIRGVACGDVVNRLREMGLVRVVGRAEVVGRPMLYGTTKKFLDVFGLADLDDLPPMEALALKRAADEPESAGDTEPVPEPRAAASG